MNFLLAHGDRIEGRDIMIVEGKTELRLRFNFSCLDISKFLETNIKNIGAYEEGRAQVPIEIVKQLVDRGMIGKRDLYSFLYDPNFKKQLKPTKKKK